MALKELDYLGHTSSGRLRDRVLALQDAVLCQLEERHQVSDPGTTPERVKTLRQCLIGKLDELNSNGSANGSADQASQLHQDMEDVFFVIQCFSYPGDYLAENPTPERLAETVDKFEEDVLGRDLPSLRGRREVHIQFGEPIEVNAGGGRDRVTNLSQQMQQRVQDLLDGLTAKHPRNGHAKESTTNEHE